MTGEPWIAIPDVDSDADVTLYAQPGLMRMILHGALKDADLWARSNASLELKGHWARRAIIIRALYDKLPTPVNPRDPYEDLPDEPTPEEAAEIWAGRRAAEETRIAARVTAAARKPIEDDDLLDQIETQGDYTQRMTEQFGEAADIAPVYDEDDLLA